MPCTMDQEDAVKGQKLKGGRRFQTLIQPAGSSMKTLCWEGPSYRRIHTQLVHAIDVISQQVFLIVTEKSTDG